VDGTLHKAVIGRHFCCEVITFVSSAVSVIFNWSSSFVCVKGVQRGHLQNMSVEMSELVTTQLATNRVQQKDSTKPRRRVTLKQSSF